ncbi:hypothetical protein EDB86DRAFT_2840794 [Lactarius hatsudake]|nr:hypothetical protein EDB86DRAFT_2840794 [Lactarius hatsudake]
MTHILGLNEQDQQTVINNLLLMGMGGFTPGTPGIATPQINAIGLYPAPSLDTPSRVNAMRLDLAPETAVPTPTPSPFRADLASLSLTDSPPPRPPRSPRRPCSPRISPPSLPVVVEDDNASGRGVKTSTSLSVLDFAEPIAISSHQTTPLDQHNMTSPTPALCESPPLIPSSQLTRSPLRTFQPLFLVNAFERPREPDEVVPPRPHTPRSTEGTRNTTQVVIDPVSTRNRDRQNPDTRRPRRTLYATNNDIHRWLQQIVHDPPTRSRHRPPPPLGNITEEHTDTDPELCEYRYDRTYDHAGEGQGN